MQDPEVDRRLAATRALAEKLAISGTPTFVFDDRMVRGYLPLEQMRDLVAEVRARSTDRRRPAPRGAISALPSPRHPEYTGAYPERGQAARPAANNNRAHMSKRPQELDIEFIKALAELLRANDLTEIEVNRDYGDDDALTVRVARQAGRGVPQAPRPRSSSPRPRPLPRRPRPDRRRPIRPTTRAWCLRRWSAPPTCRPSPRRRPS